ncbi:MAG: DUF370 domain-containing protein [Bacillota bacterium]|nr:DUF370 domain-containing protein [Bacillota bacterium]
MYIHLGEEMIIQARDIIAILDKDSVNNSPLVEEFLNRQDGMVKNSSNTLFKSIVVTMDKVYFSPLSSGTLKRRSGQANMF